MNGKKEVQRERKGTNSKRRGGIPQERWEKNCVGKKLFEGETKRKKGRKEIRKREERRRNGNKEEKFVQTRNYLKME